MTLINLASFPTARREGPSNKGQTYHIDLDGINAVLVASPDNSRSSILIRSTSKDNISYFYDLNDQDRGITIYPKQTVNISGIKGSIYVKSSNPSDNSSLQIDVART